MGAESYRFRVGDFKCTAISDGTFTYAPPIFPPPSIFLFANAPREILERALREHNLRSERWTEWVSPYICLLIDTGEQLVLVDTGADGLGPQTGKLIQNLRSEGISPRDVDAVILTYGHPDHIGGNAAEGEPAFPNARFFMWADEWDFWTSGRAEMELDEHSREVLLMVARKNLPPIQGRISLVSSEAEILPGIRPVPALGHTPGHMALSVSSDGEKLLVVSDGFLHPIHLEHPDWQAAVDLDPTQVSITRRRLLNLAARDEALVLAFHFPFPGLGYIVKKGDVWRWKAI